MTVLSGIAGAVDAVNTVGRWEVATTADIQKYIASNTKKGPVRIDGNKDWNGSYQAYGATPVKMPGDAFTFTGSIDETDGATGLVIVDQAEITIDIETGAVISHVVSFSGNGALTLGAAAATDVTTPDNPTSIGCKVELGTMVAVPVYTELDNVRTITITFTAENPSYVASGDAGQTKRVAGNIDATIAISIYVDDPANIPAPNTWKMVRVFVAGLTHWEFHACIFGEASGIVCDREMGAIVECTLNLQYSGFSEVDAAMEEGHIKKPGGATWWPAA